MNFIVVDGTLSKTKRKLMSDKKLLRKALMDNPKKELEDKLKLINNKLKALDRFKSIEGKRTKFTKISRLKLTNPKKYITQCKLLCKDVVGISFNPKREEFRVQRTINGVRKYGGSFPNFDDALEGLEILINNQ